MEKSTAVVTEVDIIESLPVNRHQRFQLYPAALAADQHHPPARPPLVGSASDHAVYPVLYHPGGRELRGGPGGGHVRPGRLRFGPRPDRVRGQQPCADGCGHVPVEACHAV